MKIDKFRNTYVCLYGIEILLNCINNIKKYIDGAILAEDIECVHQMRVYSRRLRAALRVFQKCLSSKVFKIYKRNVKRITKSLGGARDLDVQIKYISKLTENITEKKYIPGIKRLILRLGQKRANEQENVLKTIKWLNEKKILDKFEYALRQMVIKFRILTQSGDFNCLFEKAYKDIINCMTEVNMYSEKELSPDNKKEIHELRIKVKRFRYTMELYSNEYKKELKDFIKQMKSVQTFLGEIHDCDVWSEKLDSFIEEEKKRTVEFYGYTRGFNRIKLGIKYVKTNIIERRSVLYDKFMVCWKKLGEEEYWQNLEKVLYSKIKKEDDQVPEETAPAADDIDTGKKIEIKPKDIESSPPDKNESVKNDTAEGIKEEEPVEEISSLKPE